MREFSQSVDITLTRSDCADEYARTGTPLPRPIAARKVTVSQLSLLNFTPGIDHSYQFPTETLGETEKAELEAMEKMIRDGETVVPNAVKERSKGKRGDYVAPAAPVADLDPSSASRLSEY